MERQRRPRRRPRRPPATPSEGARSDAAEPGGLRKDLRRDPLPIIVAGAVGALLLLILVLVLSLGGDGDAPEAVAAPDPTLRTFRTPSGNIACVMRGGDPGSATCRMDEPRRAAEVVDGARGEVLPFAAVEPISARAVLPYERSVTRAGLRCTSRPPGVTCLDSDTGRGFFLGPHAAVPIPRSARDRRDGAAVGARGVRSGPAGDAATRPCSPHYVAVCVPPYPPDVDCDDIRASVQVPAGRDPHDLDPDGDGAAC